MDKKELDLKIKSIQEESSKKIRAVQVEYCEANNPYKVGDKFTDHIGTIIIESWKYSLSERPSCVYYGIELKKDGSPRKDKNKRQAWQVNEVKPK